MVTLDQLRDQHVVVHHPASCIRKIGPRGGLVVRPWAARRTGRLQTWKTRPGQFAVGMVHGFYAKSGAFTITERNAHEYTLASECPICNSDWLRRLMDADAPEPPPADPAQDAVAAVEAILRAYRPH